MNSQRKTRSSNYGRFDWDHRHGAGAIPSAPNVRLPQYVSLNQPEVMIGNASERFDAEVNIWWTGLGESNNLNRDDDG
jgi:hypothetical protein